MANVTAFYVRFQTQNDDKDGGDNVSALILRDDQVVAEHREFGRANHEWDDNTSQPAHDDAGFGGKPGWFKVDNPGIRSGVTIAETDRPRLKLRISKANPNKRWLFKVSLLVLLDNGTEHEWLNSGTERLGHGGKTDHDFNLA